MYEPATSIVNGNIVKDLLDLCNDHFINTLIQPHASVDARCMYCDRIQTNGIIHHEPTCPYVKYIKLAKKYSRFIVAK